MQQNNCIQITINGVKIQFQGVGTNNANFEGIVEELILSDYPDKNEKLEELLQAIEANPKEIENYSTPDENPYSYLGDNLLGNFTANDAAKLVARTNIDGSKMILPLIGALNHAKVNTGVNNILITDKPNIQGVYVGANHNKIVLNRESPSFVSDLYKSLTYIHVDNQIKKNLPLKNLMDGYFQRIVQNKDNLSQDNYDLITKLENSSDLYRLKYLLTLSTQEHFYLENKALLNQMFTDISNDMISKIQDFIQTCIKWSKYEKSQYKEDTDLLKTLSKKSTEYKTLNSTINDFENNYLREMKKVWEMYYYKDINNDYFEGKVEESPIFKKHTSEIIKVNGVNLELGKLLKFRLGLINSISNFSNVSYSNDELVNRLIQAVEGSDFSFDFRGDTLPQNLEQREYIYNNPEIAAHIYNVVDPSIIKGGRVDGESVIKDLLSSHTMSTLISGDTSIYSDQFSLKGANLFVDNGSFSEFSQLNIIRDKTYREKGKNELKERFLRVEFTSSSDKLEMQLDGNVLKLNTNSPITELSTKVVDFLYKNNKSKLMIEHSTNSNAEDAGKRLEELIIQINRGKGLWTISTIETEGRNKLGREAVKVGLRNGVFVNLYAGWNANYHEFINEFSDYQYKEAITPVNYNFDQDFNKLTIKEGIDYVFGEKSQFQLLEDKVISGLLVHYSSNASLYYGALNNRFIINDGDVSKSVKILKNIGLNQNYFEIENRNKAPQIGNKYIANKSKILQNGTYYITGSNLQDGKWILSNEFNENIELSEDQLNTDNITFDKQIEIFDINGDSYIVMEKVNKLMDSNGNVVTLDDTNRDLFRQIFNPLYQEMSDITGLSYDYLASKVLPNSGYRVSKMEVIPMEISVANPKEGLAGEDVQQLVKVLSDNITRSTNLTVHNLTTSEIAAIFGTYSKQAQAKAFIYNGDIYVNMDLASTDSPIHELSHLILGDIKANDIQTYINLINKVGNNRNDFAEIRSAYPNLSESDLREEILAHVFSDYYNKILQDYDGLDQLFEELDLKSLVGKMFQLIDSMEDISGNNELMSKSISDIAIDYESKFTKGFETLSSRGSESSMMRKISNIKEQWFKDNKLEEQCQ